MASIGLKHRTIRPPSLCRSPTGCYICLMITLMKEHTDSNKIALNTKSAFRILTFFKLKWLTASSSKYRIHHLLAIHLSVTSSFPLCFDFFLPSHPLFNGFPSTGGGQTYAQVHCRQSRRESERRCYDYIYLSAVCGHSANSVLLFFLHARHDH